VSAAESSDEDEVKDKDIVTLSDLARRHWRWVLHQEGSILGFLSTAEAVNRAFFDWLTPKLKIYDEQVPKSASVDYLNCVTSYAMSKCVVNM
jgi:hypothetical protein